MEDTLDAAIPVACDPAFSVGYDARRLRWCYLPNRDAVVFVAKAAFAR
jgi:hypothetical protein